MAAACFVQQRESTKEHTVRERGPVISADDDTSTERGSWRRRVSGHLRTLTGAGVYSNCTLKCGRVTQSRDTSSDLAASPLLVCSSASALCALRRPARARFEGGWPLLAFVHMEGYSVVKRLGKGAFGEVHLVRRNDDSETLALKRIDFGSLCVAERKATLLEVSNG